MSAPSQEAVEAAMRYGQGDRLFHYDDTEAAQEHCSNLAYEVERLRCELGHAQDQLERIRTLCMGHGVGLRDDVWDVVK